MIILQIDESLVMIWSSWKTYSLFPNVLSKLHIGQAFGRSSKLWARRRGISTLRNPFGTCGPLVIRWVIMPCNYSCSYHKPQWKCSYVHQLNTILGATHCGTFLGNAWLPCEFLRLTSWNGKSLEINETPDGSAQRKSLLFACIFFLHVLSYDSSHLCFSGKVHIVQRLTSRLLSHI